MQVYLPDDLYEEIKSRNLPASELLQDAVRAEVHRLALVEAARRYVDDLVAEVGEPTARERAKARALVDQLRGRTSGRRAG